MVFLMSILVFLAGIMTYMFFPRNDQFQINMYEEEGNIVTFLNQHQAAKDYLYQMIKWHPTSHPSEVAPYGITYNDLASMMPSIMRGDKGEVTHDISNEEETENPNIPQEGYFTSAVVCLNDTNQMANCPTDKQYVMTYGYTPYWWSSKTNRNQTWLKTLLKRSYGSDNCGVLESVGEYYAINNGQKYGGIVRTAINGKMEKVLPTSVSTWLNKTFPDLNKDVLLCLSSIKDVYKGNPVFMWDSINNGGDSHQAGIGIPLIGNLDNNIIKDINNNSLALETYTIVGVVNGNRTSGSNLLKINDTDNIQETCTTEKCTISVRNVSMDIPLNTSYSFVYTTTSEQETLNIYYSKESEWIKETESSATQGPTFSESARITEDENNKPYLSALRIYNTISTREINHNIKADKKRFGL